MWREDIRVGAEVEEERTQLGTGELDELSPHGLRLREHGLVHHQQRGRLGDVLQLIPASRERNTAREKRGQSLFAGRCTQGVRAYSISAGRRKTKGSLSLLYSQEVRRASPHFICPIGRQRRSD